jgi:Holliday junction resolvasome RuvABC DNA-binding subunit
VRDALVNLGYSPEEVRDAVALLGDDKTVEEMLREALRSLAGGR